MLLHQLVVCFGGLAEWAVLLRERGIQLTRRSWQKKLQGLLPMQERKKINFVGVKEKWYEWVQMRFAGQRFWIMQQKCKPPFLLILIWRRLHAWSLLKGVKGNCSVSWTYSLVCCLLCLPACQVRALPCHNAQSRNADPVGAQYTVCQKILWMHNLKHAWLMWKHAKKTCLGKERKGGGGLRRQWNHSPDWLRKRKPLWYRVP